MEFVVGINIPVGIGFSTVNGGKKLLMAAIAVLAEQLDYLLRCAFVIHVMRPNV